MIPANLLKKVRLACLSVVILTVMMSHSNAEIPSLLNYQGQVTHSGTGEPLDSIVSIVFSIYDDSVTSTPLWTETHGSISVVEGLFAVLLGSQNPVPELTFADAERWLGIKVGADSEITPRTRFVSAAYSFHSQYADSAGTSDDGDWTDDGGGNIYRLSGNIGIGTSSPSYKLEIDGTTDFGNTTTYANGVVGMITWGGDSSFIVRGQPGWKLSLGADGSNDHIVIDTNGKVGIGTTTPSYQLEVDGTTDFGDVTTYGNGATGMITWGASGFIVRGQSGWKLSLGAGGTNDHLVIDTDGKVGIGTSSPANPLHVVGSSTTAQFQQTASQALILFKDQATVNSPHIGSSGDDFVVLTGPTSSEKLRVNSTGYLSLRSSGTHSLANFTSATTVNAPHIGASGDNLVVLTGPGTSEVFRINSNGNVGIGTTSPSSKLHVSGTGRFDNALTVNGPGGSVNAITANTNGAFAALAGLNSGLGSGVYAESNSIENKFGAVHGKALQNGGAGIYGETNSPGVEGGSSLGVFGEATNTGTSTGGAALAVLGRVWSYQLDPPSVDSPSVPVGVFGEAMHTTGISWGVAGETHSTHVGAAGVKGTLKASGATGRAIWGEAPTTGWAGYFDGNVRVTGDLSALGSKPAVLEDFEDGKIRYIYSQESPEIWFEDFGEGRLKQGVANIELDALFLETVTINSQHPMKVFVTLNGDCNGIYVERSTSSFIVKELNNGKSSAQFTYRVVAKRKGFENKRFEVNDKFIASTEAINQNQ